MDIFSLSTYTMNADVNLKFKNRSYGVPHNPQTLSLHSETHFHL